MPEDEEEFDQEHEGLDPHIREALRNTKQVAREKKAAEERATSLERELAFAKAGIPDTPLTTTLAKTYDGENDATSVRAYFEGLGVDLTSTSAGVSTQQTPEPQGASEPELAAQRQVTQLGAGGEAGGDLRFEDAMNSANNQSEVMELIRSAPEGARDQNGFRIAVPEIN